MKKYASINQFRDVIKQVKHSTYYVGKDEEGNAIMDRNLPLPTLTFVATAKVHGTNGSARLDLATNTITWQSRERELSIESDNAGMCMWASQKKITDVFMEMFEYIKKSQNSLDGVESICIFYEWAGKNIQKGVAINGLPAMAIIFQIDICYADTEHRKHYKPWTFENLVKFEYNELNIYDVSQFGVWVFDIDFNHPEVSQNALVELCNQIEEECPVGKYFGRVKGVDNTVGEGFVLSHKSDKYGFLIAKVKGEKHANSKVKTTASVDLEKFAAADDFANNYTTTARLDQGFGFMAEMNIDYIKQNVGTYIKWINQDIFKEHNDVIVESQLDPKVIANKVSVIARNYYFNFLDTLV